MRSLQVSQETPIICLLLLGSFGFAAGAPLVASGLLAGAALSAQILLRMGLRPRVRSLSSAALGMGIAAAGFALMPWNSTAYMTLLIGAAGWLKLAERPGARDRFVAAIAAVWLVGMAVVALPSTLALGLLAAAFAAFGWGLYRDAARFGPARRLSWLATIGPALILTAVFFLFTPRVTGNLNMLAFVLNLPFVIETAEEAARTPPKEEMELKEFQDTEKEELRVLVADFSGGTGPFEKTAPPVSELYWRGPVFWQYGESRWRARPGFKNRGQRLRSKLTGEKMEAQMREATRFSIYDVTVFPNRGNWLYGLDIPAFTPPSSYITQDWQLMNMNPVRDLLTYNMMSIVEYRAGAEPDEDTRALGLQLPEGEEPRTIALGRELAEKHGEDLLEIARQGRALFDNGFKYDRGAPVIEGKNPIDAFLFDKREGYGMHFATAYALMMRAAGIPARVVSGYQGGFYMFLIEKVYVTQADSHAWVELWLDDYGWVRMDVARAAKGIADGTAEKSGASNVAALEEEVTPQEDTPAPDAPQEAAEEEAAPGLFASDWLSRFDAKLQGELLEATGLSANAGTLALVGTGVVVLLILGHIGTRVMALWLGVLRLPVTLRMNRLFCRRIAPKGMRRRPFEGLRSFVARVLLVTPREEEEIRDLMAATDWLCAASYGNAPGPAPAFLTRMAGMQKLLQRFVKKG